MSDLAGIEIFEGWADEHGKCSACNEQINKYDVVIHERVWCFQVGVYDMRLCDRCAWKFYRRIPIELLSIMNDWMPKIRK